MNSRFHTVVLGLACLIATLNVQAQTTQPAATEPANIPTCVALWAPFDNYALKYGRQTALFDDVESMAAARSQLISTGVCTLPTDAQLPTCAVVIQNGSVAIKMGSETQSLLGDYERLMPLRERISAANVTFKDLTTNKVCVAEEPPSCSIEFQAKKPVWRSWDLFDFDGFVLLRGKDTIQKYKTVRAATALLSSLQARGLCAKN